MIRGRLLQSAAQREQDAFHWVASTSGHQVDMWPFRGTGDAAEFLLPHPWCRGTVETIVPFAALVADESKPIFSEEHDEWRWTPLAAAIELVPYEPQRAALRRIGEDSLERPELAELYRILTTLGADEKSR